MSVTLAAAAGFQGRRRGRFNWREGKEDTGAAVCGAGAGTGAGDGAGAGGGSS